MFGNSDISDTPLGVPYSTFSIDQIGKVPFPIATYSIAPYD